MVHKKAKLTLSMIMRDEADRYLTRVLQAHRQWIDEAVIIDDGSSDHSVAVCKEVLAGIPLHLIENQRSKFHNEVELRKQQWQETVSRNPDWILNMDADEMFEEQAITVLNELKEHDDFDVVYFRLYDMWSETHFRDDHYWSSHRTFRPFLFRYDPGATYSWQETAQHSGRFPVTIRNYHYVCHPLKIQHLGWAREQDRVQKYARYQRLDPEAKFGWKEQYESILDHDPHLVAWEDEND